MEQIVELLIFSRKTKQNRTYVCTNVRSKTALNLYFGIRNKQISRPVKLYQSTMLLEIEL